MAIGESILLTEEGWEQLQKELSSLRSRQGPRTAEYRGMVEDSEPEDTITRYVQSEIASVDRRIAQLEDVLSRAIPVRRDNLKPGEVGIGSRVMVRWEDGDEETYILVGSPEIDVQHNRISCESPVGRALAGKYQGEWVEVSTPGGESRLEILNVE